jgi:hypothetical protein
MLLVVSGLEFDVVDNSNELRSCSKLSVTRVLRLR